MFAHFYQLVVLPLDVRSLLQDTYLTELRRRFPFRMLLRGLRAFNSLL